MSQATKTALSSARERFLAGLARRGEELRPLVAAFSSDTSARVPRAELQRRLHTLLASAQLFEESELVDTLQALTSRLDAVGLGGEPWRLSDGDLLSELLTQLSAQAETLPLTAAAPRPASAKPGVLSSGARPSLPAFAPSAQGVRQATERTLPSAVLLTRVLLVCSRPHAASLRAVLDEAPIELVHAADPEQALTLLQSASPTCALLAVEFATLPDIDLVRRLQGDPQSRLGGVYLLLPAGAAYDAEFVRQTGAEGVLIEPISWQTLEPFVDRASERRGRGGLRALGDHPEGTVEEIASFFAEEVRSGLLHALREETTERIRLPDTRELSEVARSAIDRARAHLSGHGPAKPPPSAAESEVPVTSEPSGEDLADAVRVLAGKRVLVVDDDPAVLWFFAGLLREAGATVLQARDGREALELARRKRPQLVVSDILMPKMDGFALCRELRRDVLQSRVPVVLLTWKDDHLARTAGASDEMDPSAYLRKEAGGGEALSVLAAALAPRQQLLAALLDPGAIAGTVEELGIANVLECVAEARPNARLRVEDNSRLFELDIRDGQRISVTKTASDGSFTRGERALTQLLGIKRGSFSVLTQSGSLRSPLPEVLPRALQSAGKELSILLDAVSGERLNQVALMSFDEALLAVWAGDMPAQLREVVKCFQTPSVTAQQLLDSHRFESGALEQSLRDLASYGVITGVWDAQGSDLIGHARRQRSLSPVSSTTLPAISRSELEAPAMPIKVAASEFPALQAHAKSSAGLGPALDLEPLNPMDGVADLLEPEEHPQEERVFGVKREADRARESVPAPASPLAASANEPAKRSVSTPPPLPFPMPRGAESALIAGVRPMLGRIRTVRRDAVRLGATLAALAALGYLGGMLLEDPSRLFSSAEAPSQAAVATPRVVAPTHETSLRSGTDPGLALGTVLPYIDTSRGVAVGSDEGLVVFEHRGSEPVPSLEIDRHPLQAPPLALALPASAHQLSLHAGDETLIFTLVVRAGETRIITLPLPTQ